MSLESEEKVMMLLTDAGQAASLVDFKTVDTSAVVPTITAAIGVGIGICITIRVIKKGYATLMGFIGRA